MGSGSEVRRLIWCGNWFPLKLMRGACEGGSHPLPGVRAGSWAPAGAVERAPVAASVLAGPGPRCPLPSGGGERTHRAPMRKGSDPGSKALWAPRKALLRNFAFNRHPPWASQMDSVVPQHTPRPLRPGPFSAGGSWGQEVLGRAVCCQICPLQDGGRGAEPLPAPLHCGSQNTCGVPGIALQADDPAEGERRGRPEPDNPHTCKTTPGQPAPWPGVPGRLGRLL